MNIRSALSVACGLIAAMSIGVSAQEVGTEVHGRSTTYEWPTDPQVLQKLDQWRDLKFGVIFHWGLYCVPGIVESWSICSEDVDWIGRRTDIPYDEYKKWYFGLKDVFNPVRFNPSEWADIMHDAGMKYMVFTTKHHDGFCMYDSKYTDFSIAKAAFRNNPRRDVAKHVFEAFRSKDFWIGCYFSKPDWHCEWFWNPNYATADRRQNYKKDRHPEWWQNYKTFTRNQLTELTTNYGSLDILWLDGGWVRGDDVDLDEILVDARKRHPGLISVDRAVHGKNENYQTPERGIPEVQLDNPWESCITLSNDWGWVPNAPYKSAQKVINTLVEATAKGGALLLGIGPDAQGTIEQPIVERLQVIGRWLRANGKAIYGTRNASHYHDGNVWFTADKDGATLYAIYALPEGETLPATIAWSGNAPRGAVKLLSSGKALKTVTRNGTTTVTLPKNLVQEPVAMVFKVK